MSDAALRPEQMTPSDAAALWLLRRDGGHDIVRDPAFVAWRENAENAAAWDHAAKVWDASGAAPADDPLFEALRRDALQARPPRLPAWAAAAASLLVVVLGGVLAWPRLAPPLQDPVQPGPGPEAVATFAVAAGPPDSFTLRDGSRVTLDSNSAIAVAYEKDSRPVRLLRGRAYFNVVHDPAKPFTVAAGPRTVTDLGTEFDMRLGGESLTVVLVKGAVAVSPTKGKTPVTLSAPGQQFTATPGKADAVTQTDLGQIQSWRTVMLEFTDRPLSEAVAQINRYGGAPVRVTDEAAGGLPVSGRFRAGDPARFARALAAAYPLSVRIRADGGADIAHR